MRAWLGEQREDAPKVWNLGAACGVLRLWNELIEYLKFPAKSKIEYDPEFDEYLGYVYLKAGHYEQAIEVLNSVPPKSLRWKLLPCNA